MWVVVGKCIFFDGVTFVAFSREGFVRVLDDLLFFVFCFVFGSLGIFVFGFFREWGGREIVSVVSS